MFKKLLKSLFCKKTQQALSHHVSDDDLAKLEDPNNGIITCDESGIEVKLPKITHQVGWESITEVMAYKRDLGTTDLICLAILSADKRPIEIHEEMQGYVKLWHELEARLPGYQDKYAAWIMKSPPFDPKPISVWKKETQR